MTEDLLAALQREGIQVNREAGDPEEELAVGQKRMESHMAKTLLENNVVQAKTLNGMMQCAEGGCSFKDKTFTLEFPVQQWQANRAGTLHGGMICTAIDMTAAAIARFYADENFTPTVNLEVNYIRPVEIGDTLVVTARAVGAGKRITHLTCEAVIKSSGKTAATATSVYLNIDTSR